MKKKIDLGLIGETAVSLELMKMGYDVINLNTLRHNYQNIDLICINPQTGKKIYKAVPDKFEHWLQSYVIRNEEET
jgi:hypothetical protein